MGHWQHNVSRNQSFLIIAWGDFLFSRLFHFLLFKIILFDVISGCLLSFVFLCWMALIVCCVQLWDVRDGLCKQTFTGHESDINAVSVSHPSAFHLLISHHRLQPVLPKWNSVCHWLWWCHMPIVWHPCWSSKSFLATHPSLAQLHLWRVLLHSFGSN